MKLTVDEQVCLKNGLTFEEFLMAFVAHRIKNQEEILQNLVNREILSPYNHYTLTQRWSDVMDNIICDSRGINRTDEDLMELAQKMRDLYPSGKMPKTAYYYRCNNREVVLKLKKFLLTYGNYSNEAIIDATKRFVASFNGNYTYLPLIKYFVSKLKPVKEEDGTTHNVEFSLLADFLENKDASIDNINSQDLTYHLV